MSRVLTRLAAASRPQRCSSWLRCQEASGLSSMLSEARASKGHCSRTQRLRTAHATALNHSAVRRMSSAAGTPRTSTPASVPPRVGQLERHSVSAVGLAKSTFAEKKSNSVSRHMQLLESTRIMLQELAETAATLEHQVELEQALLQKQRQDVVNDLPSERDAKDKRTASLVELQSRMELLSSQVEMITRIGDRPGPEPPTQRIRKEFKLHFDFPPPSEDAETKLGQTDMREWNRLIFAWQSDASKLTRGSEQYYGTLTLHRQAEDSDEPQLPGDEESDKDNMWTLLQVDELGCEVDEGLLRHLYEGAAASVSSAIVSGSSFLSRKMPKKTSVRSTPQESLLASRDFQWLLCFMVAHPSDAAFDAVSEGLFEIDLDSPQDEHLDDDEESDSGLDSGSGSSTES